MVKQTQVHFLCPLTFLTTHMGKYKKPNLKLLKYFNLKHSDDKFADYNQNQYVSLA